MSAQQIKETVTMRDVLIRYGLTSSGKERDRIPCPLHKGTDKNFFYEPHRFKCYVCGESGTVLDFAMLYFNLPFRDACTRLSRDFGFGLDDAPPDEAALAEARRIRREKEQQAEAERLRFIGEARSNLGRIEAARIRAAASMPFIVRGEPFYPPGYREAMLDVILEQDKLDEMVQAEYFAATEAAWSKKKGGDG